MKISRNIIIVVLLFAFISPANAIRWAFWKKDKTDVIPVEVINIADAPIEIFEAQVKDIGTELMKISDIENTFTTEVFNKANKQILSYQLFWSRRLPFESYSTRNYIVNSVEPLPAQRSQNISFRRPLHFRKDAFYYVQPYKVLFEDGSVWETDEDIPDIDLSRWEQIKSEIEGDDYEKADIDNLIEKAKQQEQSKK